MGCGKGFMWSTAPPYVANVGDAKTKDEVCTHINEGFLFIYFLLQLDADPVSGADFRHMICEGEPMLCDSCHNVTYVS